MKPGAIEERAGALRREFDASFGASVAGDRPRVEDFLMLGVGGDPYALALIEIAGLHRDWRVVPMTSEAPELVGVAGNRGTLVPVYDLGALLGYPSDPVARWIVTVRSPRLAFAFARFDGHLRASTQAVSTRQGGSIPMRGTLSVAGLPRPIIDLTAVADAISRGGRAKGPAREP